MKKKKDLSHNSDKQHEKPGDIARQEREYSVPGGNIQGPESPEDVHFDC